MARMYPTIDEGMLREDWLAALDDEGIDALLMRRAADMDALDAGALPHLAFVDLRTLSQSAAKSAVDECDRLKLPVIALLPRDTLVDFEALPDVSDFVACPPDADPDAGEVVARVKQTLRRTQTDQQDDVIRAGSLVINPATYEVSLRGKRVNLRFKEYELLRLLATNPGRVYSREALLSNIWGYDYFGGTRTVDVHVRRLRSKIEDAEQPFIETIWNVGYRFRDVSRQA